MSNLDNILKELRSDKRSVEVLKDIFDAHARSGQRMSNSENQRTEELARHNNVMGNIAERIKEAQEDCPHLLTTHYPDASGGNDSFTKCDTCGKVL